MQLSDADKVWPLETWGSHVYLLPKATCDKSRFQRRERPRGCWNSVISKDHAVILRQLALKAVITLSALDKSVNTFAACSRGLCSWSSNKESTGADVALKVEWSFTNNRVGGSIPSSSCWSALNPKLFLAGQASTSVSELETLGSSLGTDKAEKHHVRCFFCLFFFWMSG